MQINQYPNQATSLTVEDRFDTDKNLGLGVWQSQQFDLPTLVDGIINTFPNLFDTIYTADGTLNGNRTVELDDFKISFLNGNINIGTTGYTGGLFRLEVLGTTSGIVSTAPGTAIAASSTGTAIAASSLVTGLFSSAPRNIFMTSGSTSTVISSSLLDCFSTTQGTRTAPRMTEAERDAIVSPADYLEIVNTTRERKEIYKPFWGWHPVGEITPDWGYWWIDEATGASGEFVFSATNGGLLTTLIDSALSPTRLAGLSTGVNTNGEYRHITNPYLLGSTGLKSWSTKVAFDTLSNITNRYVARSGYVNNSAGLSTSIGMYFLYDEGGVYGTATASANWLCVCFTSGSPTIVDSGIPVISSPANPLQKLQILDSGTGNNVKFYIDNALVATITTQIPTSSQALSAGNIITKQAGTTARIMYDDYVEAKEKFNTPR